MQNGTIKFNGSHYLLIEPEHPNQDVVYLDSRDAPPGLVVGSKVRYQKRHVREFIIAKDVTTVEPLDADIIKSVMEMLEGYNTDERILYIRGEYHKFGGVFNIVAWDDVQQGEVFVALIFLNQNRGVYYQRLSMPVDNPIPLGGRRYGSIYTVLRANNVYINRHDWDKFVYDLTVHTTHYR